MRSRWNDRDAEAIVKSYEKRGISQPLALRVYTTRLLGRDPRLVLHGGGNVSVKLKINDYLGKSVEALHVKGSGWDMANIEPEGLPALRLSDLRQLILRDTLSDEEMIVVQRAALLNPNSPNPSVETLLHAFLPYRFIDHTHSTSVLALTNQKDGENICRDVFSNSAALVPYVMPGFALAKLAYKIQAENPKVLGLILLKHGIFSFGDTARESYENMIKLVSLADAKIEKNKQKPFVSVLVPKNVASVADVAPILRGAIGENIDSNEGIWRRQILHFRTSKSIIEYVNGADVKRYALKGVITPDHTIRIKNWPLIAPLPIKGELDHYSQSLQKLVNDFVRKYKAYFNRHNGVRGPKKKELDPRPRVVLVPGLGLFGLGRSAKDAQIAADIAENNALVVTNAEAIGDFESVSEEDIFDIEYWVLEQQKLSKIAEKPFSGQVVLITGGGSGIGAATAESFSKQGAEIIVVDINRKAAQVVAQNIGSKALALGCDVTNPNQVRDVFDFVCESFGGVDVTVSNAGAAWQGKIGEVSERELRDSFELNFFAHQTVAQNSVRIMRAQGTGGCLLFNISKQAVNPGPDFGPYGIAKAATLALMRQYAIDYGSLGIRSNAVNADRVLTKMFKNGLLDARAKARGLTVEQYLSSGNLLGREVKPLDVAQAFVDLALAKKTTAAVFSVDGGNIGASLR